MLLIAAILFFGTCLVGPHIHAPQYRNGTLLHTVKLDLSRRKFQTKSYTMISVPAPSLERPNVAKSYATSGNRLTHD
jgi:hypothetical protein